MTGAAIGHLKAAECLIILISDSSAVPLEVHIAEKYRYPRQVYVARDPGCCEVVSGASCPSRGKCSSGPSIHQKPAIWRLWVDISLLHLGTRQMLFPLGCCVGLGLW